MREIAVVSRGCGSAVPGGYYLSCTGGPMGTLARWSWILGQGVEGGNTLYLSPPERMHTVFNLPYTLATCEHQTEKVEGVTLVTPLDKLRPMAILDHVGKAHYTAFQFYDEIEQLLPNRRIAPSLAAKLVPLLPMPIVFTHDEIPVVHSTLHRKMLIDWAMDVIQKNNLLTPAGIYSRDELDTDPTWINEKWGLKAKDERGDNHWLVSVLQAIDHVGGKDKIPELIQTYLDEDENNEEDFMMRDDISWIEQPFGASWITRVTYVCKPDDTADALQTIANTGIEPVRLANGWESILEPVENKF